MITFKKSLLTGKPFVSAIILTVSLAAASSAEAIAITNWTNITDNGNTEIGDQLLVDFTDNGDGTVNFRFKNEIGVESSITDVYFEDIDPQSFLTSFTLSPSSGVAFTQDANPANLPGGNQNGIGFEATHSADANAPGG